jgi:hemolysin activation/secretion protein
VLLLSEDHETDNESVCSTLTAAYLVPDALIVQTHIETWACPPGNSRLRDMPTNAYSGNLFNVNGLFNDQSFGSDNDYQSYSAEFRSYYEMSDQLVLAWQIEGCYRSGTFPLWDSCTVGLRGFPATDYLGKSSAIAQVEARWRMSERWGLVGFAGGGRIDNNFSEVEVNDIIPSYGVGIRFMVLKSKRINIRLDYGRSDNSDAIHLSVGEAF